MMTKTPWNFDGELPEPDPRLDNAIICPGCGALGTTAAASDSARQQDQPRCGDPMVCMRCEIVFVYEPGLPGRSRHPLASEAVKLERHPDVMAAKHVLRAIAEGRPVPLIAKETKVIDDAVELTFEAIQTVRREKGIPEADVDVIMFVIDRASPGGIDVHIKSSLKAKDMVRELNKVIEHLHRKRQ
jgi:hypothetical protein